MIVDTSAIVAILRDEHDAAVHAQATAAADVRRLSAASYLECGIVLDSQRAPVVSRGLDDLLQGAEFVVQPVTEHRPLSQLLRDVSRESEASRVGTRSLSDSPRRLRMCISTAIDASAAYAHHNDVKPSK